MLAQSKSVGLHQGANVEAKTVRYRRKSAAARRRELIEAGIACLGRGGMAGFTIDEICRQAGVSRGLVNHHFDSKEDLLLRIYADMTQHLVDETRTDDPAVRLAAIIDASFDDKTFDRDNLRAWLSVWGQVPSQPALAALHRQRYRHYLGRIEAALRDLGTRAGLRLDAPAVARQLVALIDGLWLEYCLHGDEFSLVDARADCLAFLCGHGIELETAGGRPHAGRRA